jgi:hypothetical protein
LRDHGVRFREYALYASIAVVLGLGLRFLHFHARWPSAAHAAGAFGFTFLLIAIPEELFFRGWLQNLLERRLGRTPALLVTAVLFGLSHFNWRYVVMAALAGIFYGRAWRQERRVGAYLLSERFGHMQASTAGPRFGDSGNWLSPCHLPPLRIDVVRFSSIACKWHSSCIPGYRRHADFRIQQSMTS